MFWDGKITVVGFGKHGKVHAMLHLSHGSKLIEICDQDESLRIHAEKYGFSFASKNNQITQKQPWLVDICSWNDTHLDEILNYIEKGADVMIVEKPAVMSVVELENVLKTLAFTNKTVFVAEHYIYSDCISLAISWLKAQGQKPTSIHIDMSKNRTNDYIKERGGSSVRLVDVEIPHIVAILKIILSNLGIDLINYGELDVIKHSDFWMGVNLDYNTLIVTINSNLNSEKLTRFVEINTQTHRLLIEFDVNQCSYSSDTSRQECLTIFDKDKSTEEKYFQSINYLDVLLKNVKQHFETPEKLAQIQLFNFQQDIKFICELNKQWNKAG